MKEKKKINISVLLMLLAIIIFIGVSYAAFVFITNSGIIEANSGKLDIAYNIENSSVNGTLIPSSTRNGGISTSVTAKLNSGSIPGNINLYITPTALTGMPFSALMWEVDVVDTSDNLLTHYEGDFTGSVINTPVKITDAYGLTSNLLTFKIYIWLNGERIDNTNFNSDNGFTATISADSISITGEFDPTYTVTFDADGGIGASGTKSVRVGEDYGLLPTPTKEGYTFLGWNGKNKFNEEEILMAIPGATYENEHYRFNARQAYEKYYNEGFAINDDGNKQYTLSLRGYVSKSSFYMWLGFADGTSECAIMLASTSEIVVSNTTSAPKQLPVVHTSFGTANDTYIKYIQLEEGTEATAYEPYYVTSDVTVTQAKNHTLKAIWKPNPTVPNQNFSDYQEVEYIEGTGTQFIDTDVLGNNNNLSLDIQYSWTELPSSETYKYVFGAYSSENDNATRILQYGPSTTYFNTNSKAGGGSGNMSLNRSINVIYHDTLSANINGEFTYSSNGNTATGSFVQGNNVANNIYLFKPSSSGYIAKIKLYDFKIYDNGVLIRNFIPMYRKSDEEVGLYDTVNDVFYQNSGTGDFVKGNDVTNS